MGPDTLVFVQIVSSLYFLSLSAGFRSLSASIICFFFVVVRTGNNLYHGQHGKVQYSEVERQV